MEAALGNLRVGLRGVSSTAQAEKGAVLLNSGLRSEWIHRELTFPSHTKAKQCLSQLSVGLMFALVELKDCPGRK